MQLSKRNPTPLDTGFGRMAERMFNDMFNDMFAPLAHAAALSDDGAAMPRLDVTENENAFDIRAELPGVKKEDVKVSLDGQRVVIEAECQQANEQRQGEQVVYSERSTRRYQRSFSLPAEVDDANAEARLEDGILRLTLPKKQGSSARRLTIS